MRVLIATDAWHPQVNGVVRTLTSLARSAKSARRRRRISLARWLSHHAAADLSGPAPRAAEPAQDRAAHREREAGRDPHRDRRPDRPSGARLLPQAQLAVHHELHHALSRIHLGALADPRRADLCRPAALPCRRVGDDDRDAVARSGAAGQRLPQSRPLDPRRRHRPVPARTRDRSCPSRGRSSPASAASRSRRTSKRSCRSTCRAPRS